MYNLHKIILLYINEMLKLKINNSKPKNWPQIPRIIHNHMCYYEYMIPGVGCCFLLKLEYYSSENLLKFISNKTLITPA